MDGGVNSLTGETSPINQNTGHFSFEAELLSAWEFLEVARKGHPERGMVLRDLQNLLGIKYSKTEAATDLEKATQIGWQALDATSKEDSKRFVVLDRLGRDLHQKYLKTKTGLDEAIRVRRETIDTMPRSHPDRLERLRILGLLLDEKFLKTKATKELEEAIRVLKEVVHTRPQYDFERPFTLEVLAERLNERYSRTGAVADLEEAIRIGREAVEITPKDSSSWAVRSSHLAIQLQERYTRLQAMNDLEEAIGLAHNVVKVDLKPDTGQAIERHNLGTRLHIKYERLQEIKDLEDAIQFEREAVNLMTKDDPDRALYLSGLGIKLISRYKEEGKPTDIEEAIAVLHEAVDLTPSDGEDLSERAVYLSNLGSCYGTRFEVTKVTADAEEAIRLGEEAVRALSETHPDRAQYQIDIGDRFGYRYCLTNNVADLEQAMSYYQPALHQPNASTIYRILAGRQILRTCSLISDWQRAYEASEKFVRLIPQLSARILLNTDKQYVLSRVVGLASDAAAVALHSGQKPSVALELLEQGRGVLAASVEELRMDIQDLTKEHPALAEHLIRARDELELPTMNQSIRSLESSLGSQTDRRYEAGKALDQLIDTIRQKPGFERFLDLLAPSVMEMQDAAKLGPIAVINISEHRCDAILVEHDQIRSLPLPNLVSEEVQRKAQCYDLGKPEILEWLWDTVANPILTSLGFLQHPDGVDWPHLWWIPTGSLTKFPLHAAGYHRQRSFNSVLDRVMSSYSSSIKTLIYGRRSHVEHRFPAQALLVAPKNSGLLHADEELETVHRVCSSMFMKPIEREQGEQNVISYLPQCKIFHFAGHGHTHTDDPSQSYLRLESEKLTVGTLLEINIRKSLPYLAYLSACGTGQIREEKFLDESIHLISACQLAGFRHVIGTLWEVDDELCADMAKFTYKGLRDGRMTDESVCLGLHRASRKLRARSLYELNNSENGFRVDPKASLRKMSENDNREVTRMPWKIKGTSKAENENLSTRNMHWVPYVHYGV